MDHTRATGSRGIIGEEKNNFTFSELKKKIHEINDFGKRESLDTEGLLDAGSSSHAGKYATGPAEQGGWRVKLDNLALIQNHDAVTASWR